MMTLLIRLGIIATVLINLLNITHAETQTPATQTPQSENTQKAVFAGGCFWCIESDFEKLDGVHEAVSGYIGGSKETANYKTVSYTETGHFEAVEVHYNPAKISYAELVEYFWRHIDPTDPNGQFCDKGSAYRSAIFYGNDDEKKVVDASLIALTKSKPFKGDIVTTIAAAKPFYKAEQYHQNYYKKNPIRYRIYRSGCGRDKTVNALWKTNTPD